MMELPWPAGLKFDERSKMNVDFTFPVTLDYITANARPGPEILCKYIVTESLVTFATTADNTVSMPIGFDYVSKKG